MPKSLLLAAAALAALLPQVEPAAAVPAAGLTAAAFSADGLWRSDDLLLEVRRGRGRGRGGDDRSDHDDHDDRDDRDDRGRDRPRIPGGSGCDDLHDILEHPECRV